MGSRDIPFAFDVEARVAALQRTGAFDAIEHQTSVSSLVFDPEQTAVLYATYSNINIRHDRAAVLVELARSARDGFHGSITRNMITSLYTARRRRG